MVNRQRSSQVESRTVDLRVRHIIGKDWPHTREDTASSAAGYLSHTDRMWYNLVSCTTKSSGKYELTSQQYCFTNTAWNYILRTKSVNKQKFSHA
jgi:hypothetical protein